MKLESTKIVVTFFLLWITTQFDIVIENYLAYFFVLSLGVLHGSNDIKIIKSMTQYSDKSIQKILLLYVSVVFGTLFIFLKFPKVTLILFVLISGYHFGEQHLLKKIPPNNRLKYLFFTIYGCLIFFMIFYANYEDVSLIIKNITQITTSKIVFRNVLIGLLLLTLIITVTLRKSNNFLKCVLEETGYLVLFYILFVNSTLLWSFAIYFIVWHSVPSLKDQILKLHGVVSFKTTLQYVKASFFYWALSITGIILLAYFTIDDESLFTLLFVALLASITVPHVFVLGKMNK